MSQLVLAIVVTALGLIATTLWFGVSRRRKAETALGINAMANMKWREIIAVLLETLRRDGYRLSADSHAVGDGGSEFLLTSGEDKILLGYKHGTSYRLTETSVREFASAIKEREATSGILLTLGLAEPAAANVARVHKVELIDGPALWPKVREFIQPQLLGSVQGQAAARTRKGLWAGTAASLVAGALVYFFGLPGLAPAPSAPTDVVAETSVAAPASATRAAASGPPQQAAQGTDAIMLQELNAAAKALADVAKLSPEQLRARRAEAAKLVSQISQVQAAAWSAPRTMLVKMSRTDGKDTVLIDEVCRILTQYEEMRFTRVQLEAPADSGLAVRWRNCS